MNRKDHGADGLIECKVAQVDTPMVIDSGSSFNTISERTWRDKHDEYLGNGARIIPTGRADPITAFAYAQSAPLNIIAHFIAPVTTCTIARPTVRAEFIVVQGANRSLMSKDTAVELNVLRMGGEVLSIVTQGDRKKETFPVAPYPEIDLDIDDSVRPSRQYYYRIPLAFEAKVNQRIQDMLDTGIIERYDGEPSWMSGLSIVIKDADKFRLVLNMRRVNQAIRRPYVIIPTIEDIRNKIGGAGYFSKYDLTSAFFHLVLNERSRNMTCFMTRTGVYRYRRLAFGLVSAPEIFQRFMDKVLEGLEGAAAYLDDILVFAPTAQSLGERSAQVKERLRHYKLSVNEDKSEEGKQEIVFLGHRLNKDGINIEEVKRECIMSCRHPESKSELRSFLGLAGFVSHYIIGYSDMTEPLWKTLRGTGIFQWSQEQDQAFDALKTKIAECTTTLGAFDANQPVILYTDASPVALSAVMTQSTPDGLSRIISCSSRTLTDTERRYDQTNKEALAMVWACEHHQFYLLGRHFTLKTDSSGAVSSLKKDDLSTNKCIVRRINGYKSRMEMFSITYVIIPSTQNIADAASRLSTESPPESVEERAPFEIAEITNEPNIPLLADILTADEVRELSRTDETTQSIVLALGSDASWPGSITSYERYKDELVFAHGVLARAGRIVVPLKARQKAIEIAHEGHPGINGTKRRLRVSVWWPGMDREVECYVNACKVCFHIIKAQNMTPMQRSKMPSKSWELLAIDHFGPIHDLNNSHVIALIDYHSRYLFADIVKKVDFHLTKLFLDKIFEVRGFCTRLRSDNGAAFRKQFTDYCIQRGIKPEHSCPYTPFQNGCIEAAMRIIGKSLKVSQAERGPFGSALRKAVIAHNSIPHSVSGLIPAEAHFGGVVRRNLPRLPTLPAKLDVSAAQERDWYMKLKDKDRRDRIMRAKESDIKLGDHVVCINRARAKGDSTYFEEQHRVISAKNGTLTILSRNGTQRAIHVKDVKLVPPKLQEEYVRQSRAVQVQPQPAMRPDTPPAADVRTVPGDLRPQDTPGEALQPPTGQQSLPGQWIAQENPAQTPDSPPLVQVPQGDTAEAMSEDEASVSGAAAQDQPRPPSKRVKKNKPSTPLRRSTRACKGTRKDDFTYLLAVGLMQDHADVLDLVEEGSEEEGVGDESSEEEG